MDTKSLLLFCDGASRGNPGSSAIGGVCFWGVESEILLLSLEQFKVKKFGNTKLISFYSERIHDTTNNQAEYLALEYGLEYILERLQKAKRCIKIVIYMDSQLIVYQVLGKYKVKNSELKYFCNKARTLITTMKQEKHLVLLKAISREKNQIADYFANQAFNKKKMVFSL